MEETGFLVYGYNQKDAQTIQKDLSLVLKRDLLLFSASGRERQLLIAILENPNTEIFEEKESKIILFLGFEDNDLQTALKAFPAEIKRPIFCGLTDQNIRWPFTQLLEHLQEEDMYWKNKRK